MSVKLSSHNFESRILWLAAGDAPTRCVGGGRQQLKNRPSAERKIAPRGKPRGGREFGRAVYNNLDFHLQLLYNTL